MLSSHTIKDTRKHYFMKYDDCYMEILPEVISLSCDETCNLSCHSCRSHKKANSKEENDKLKKVLETIIRPGLNSCKKLFALGSGEFFLSTAVQDFFKTLTRQDFPHLKIDIATNAQLFSREKWSEFCNLKGMIDTFIVSVDAAEKNTYELIRTGGKWEKLQTALFIIQDMRKNNEIEHFKLNFVVQKCNFKEINKFISMAKRLNVDIVNFQRIINWGTFSETDFFDMDVMNPDNVNYCEAKAIIQAALKNRDIIIEQNCLVDNT